MIFLHFISYFLCSFIPKLQSLFNLTSIMFENGKRQNETSKIKKTDNHSLLTCSIIAFVVLAIISFILSFGVLVSIETKLFFSSVTKDHKQVFERFLFSFSFSFSFSFFFLFLFFFFFFVSFFSSFRNKIK